MVSLLIVSHSENIAKGVKELVLQMAPNIDIDYSGGTFDGELGSDYNKIYAAMDKLYNPDGILVLFDLGSSCMSAKLAKETMELVGKDNIHIVDAALVEGAVVAAVQISLGLSMEEVIGSIENLKLGKM